MKMKCIAALVWCAAFSLMAAEGEWMTDLAKAQAKAKTENKMVMLEFTGSDWCPPCMQMQKDVFSTKEFMDYAKKNLVLVEVDFPRRKAQSEELKKANDALQKRFKIKGYPTVVLLDKDGNKLVDFVGYRKGGPKAFIESLEKAKKG